jgi:hypothetical protein
VIGQHIFYSDVPDPGRRDTPRLIDVAQYLGQAISGGEPRTQYASARGPRAGRVNGVIQYAPAEAAGQALPSEAPPADVNAAATPTMNGVALNASTSTSVAAPQTAIATAP